MGCTVGAKVGETVELKTARLRILASATVKTGATAYAKTEDHVVWETESGDVMTDTVTAPDTDRVMTKLAVSTVIVNVLHEFNGKP